MSELRGRSAIVTGAAQGLGRAFAEALVRAGADVTLCDAQASTLEVARSLPGPGKAVGVVADVAREADLRRLVDTARATFGHIDTLLNNAGRWRRTPVTTPLERALADWEFIMDTNLRGLLLLSRLCVPEIATAGGGDIVNVSTYYVLPARSAGTNSPDTDVYNASKWALNGLTQAWARALADKKIRVNALSMGATDTPMLRALWSGDPPAELVRSWLRPEQIAGQLLALLEEGPGGRTGENIGAWVGAPVELGPRKPPHRAITG